MASFAVSVILALLGFSSQAESDGRLVRLSGSTFSLEVLEPQGWTLATRAAPQIANFIFHPQGTDWRGAEAVVFVRIVPREESEKPEHFIESSGERFKDGCAFGEKKGKDPLLLGRTSFHVVEFRCPGVREEVVAVTDVSGAFVVFTLSVQPGHSIDTLRPVLRSILKSFSWHNIATDGSVRDG